MFSAVLILINYFIKGGINMNKPIINNKTHNSEESVNNVIKILKSIAPITMEKLNQTIKDLMINWYFTHPKNIKFILFTLERNNEINKFISNKTIIINNSTPDLIIFKTNNNIIKINSNSKKWSLNGITKDITFNPRVFINTKCIRSSMIFKVWKSNNNTKFFNRISNFIKCIENTTHDISDFYNMKFTFPNNKNNISYKDFNLINRKGKIIHFYIDKSGKYTAEILT